MIELAIPGFGDIRAEHLVLDYNGTLAVDGRPVAGVKEALAALASRLTLHVVTADTFGHVRTQMVDVNCTVSVLAPGRQDEAKRRYVADLGADRTVAIGNGRNDARMLETSRLGIAVILAEGASPAAIGAADIVCTDILSALALLAHPLRLTATLRT
jgi:soluble P-type ATPase